MNSSTKYVLDVLHDIIKDLEKGIRTPKELELELLQRVSKKQLLDCLTDESLDSDDVSACKEMLKITFNFEMDIN